MSTFRRLAALAAVAALVPLSLAAQDGARVSGRVTSTAGTPEAAVLVRIEALGAGTLTAEDGTYTLLVPPTRLRAPASVRITASRVGLVTASHALTLAPGGSLTRDFTLRPDVLQIEGIVAVGQGITQDRRAIGNVVSTVPGDLIRNSNESNVVAALAGKAPNVWVTKSAGDPGAGAYILVRGAKTVVSFNTQPLFVVDGMPVDNSSNYIEAAEIGTVVQNRAADINPNDIQSVEILKGPAASAIYGSRAANGVVLITTKSGRRNSSRATFRTTYSRDEVSRTLPLQTTYGQGIANPFDPDEDLDPVNIRSWGRQLAAGTPVFDHAGELYRRGASLDANLEMSGGGERSTYFLSLGVLDQEGVLRGSSAHERVALRVKGEHEFSDRLKVGASLAYTRSHSDLITQGSSLSGVQLTSLRQPPEFNACRSVDEGGTPGACWLNQAGLHYSYRNPNPVGINDFRGFDNPFWVLNEVDHVADVGRVFGNLNVQYQAAPWLSVNWLLGADYANDARRSVYPKGSSDFPEGRMVRADLLNEQYDHSLLATARFRVNERVGGTVTVGQNLNQSDFHRYQVNGNGLVFGADQLQLTVVKTPLEHRTRVRTEGYFAQATADVVDRLFLTGALRLDASSTFGPEAARYFLYPKLSAAYDFSRLPGIGDGLDVGKVRLAYGVAGNQPLAYSDATGYLPTIVGDAWLFPNGLHTTYFGKEGLVPNDVQGNPAIRPERTREVEAGVDLAFWNSRVALGLTYYSARTRDGLVEVPQAWSSGYISRWDNALEFSNRGWEATLDVNPIQRERVKWTVGLQWARNDGCVLSLGGEAKVMELEGFPGSSSAAVAPLRDQGGNVVECYDYGALVGHDFIRFGRGRLVKGVAIDAAYPDAPPGALYINEDGFPVLDTEARVIGDPNPDWTGSVRTALTLFDRLQISGLLDIKHGGQMWNGTRGALYSYGTHRDTESWHGAGKVGVVFGDSYFAGEPVAGPGAGKPVVLNWLTWGFIGPGNGFTGPASQFVEDAGFVKLRDVTVAYTLDQPFVRRYGFSTVELSVSGRNLKTWTRYTGLDPETNLTGQTPGRGLDFFNNPQTRSYVVSVTLNR